MMKKFVSFFMYAAMACLPLTLVTACDSDDDDPNDPAATTVLTTCVEVEYELSDDIVKYCDITYTYSDTQGEHTLTNPAGEACTIEYNGVKYPGIELDAKKYGDHTGVSNEVKFVFKAKEGVTPTENFNFLVKRTVDGTIMYANGDEKDLNEKVMEKSSIGIKPEGLATAINTLNTLWGSTKASVTADGTVVVE